MQTEQDKRDLAIAKNEMALHSAHMFESLKIAQEMYLKYYEADTLPAPEAGKDMRKIDHEIFFDPLVMKLNRVLTEREQQVIMNDILTEQVVAGGIGICFCWQLAHTVDHILNPSPH